MGEFLRHPFAFERRHMLVQLVFKLFKVGRAMRPLLGMFADKLSQTLKSRTLQNGIPVIDFHTVASVTSGILSRLLLCTDGYHLSIRSERPCSQFESYTHVELVLVDVLLIE